MTHKSYMSRAWLFGALGVLVSYAIMLVTRVVIKDIDNLLVIPCVIVGIVGAVCIAISFVYEVLDYQDFKVASMKKNKNAKDTMEEILSLFDGMSEDEVNEVFAEMIKELEETDE